MFRAELAQLDTVAIETAGSYDNVYREITKLDIDGDGIGESQRLEKTPIQIRCQVEDNIWEELRAHELGNNPNIDLSLTFHFRDLETDRLVRADGNAAINIGDRLVAIRDKFGAVVHAIPTPPGLYVTEATPVSYGLNMADPRRNLLVVHFQERSPV